MLHSLLVNGGEQVHVHYLHSPQFPSDWKDGLTAMVEREQGSISFYEIDDERCAQLPTEGFTRKATWYRIFLPELLADVERVLYLDSDLLVLDSLVPLWTIDLAHHYVAAVTNVFQIEHLWRPTALGLSSPLEYFNAGVMLLNLDLMRRNGCSEALREYATEHAAELGWRDQDAVNVVLGRRRLPLAPRWNCMNSFLTLPWSAYVFGVPAFDEARGNPAIRHFEGPGSNKPWHYLCERNMRDLYAHHRSQTPWPEFRLEGVTPINFGRRASRSVRRVAAGLRPEARHDPSLADRDSATEWAGQLGR
jgi:lipopolysaccharide biosynthesis glycosyltransferase